MNSFGNIEWLPSPGITPDKILYLTDIWTEQIEILFAADSSKLTILSSTFAKEKLAEVIDMLRKGLTDEAKYAARHYVLYIERLTQYKSLPNSNDDVLQAVGSLTTLLEHKYIISVEYAELPSLYRQEVIIGLIDKIDMLYIALEERLPKKATDSLFFKKDEVSWSWEIANELDAIYGNNIPP